MTAPRILITDEHQRIVEVDFRDIAPVSKPRMLVDWSPERDARRITIAKCNAELARINRHYRWLCLGLAILIACGAAIILGEMK